MAKANKRIYKILNILGNVMGFVYLFLGVAMLFINTEIVNKQQRMGVAIIIIVYGVFRIFRTLKKSKEDEKAE